MLLFKNSDSWAECIHIIMVNHTLPGRLNPKAPSWITQDPKEIEELIIKYAKEDLAASQIGIKTKGSTFHSTCKAYHKKDNYKSFRRK